MKIHLLSSVATALSAAFLTTATARAETWQRIGPDYKIGEATTYVLEPHPQRAGEFLVGTRPGGLQRSIDGGKTWQKTTEAFDASGHVGSNQESIARCAGKPDVVYAGIEKLGVRRSDDGGATWRDVASTLPKGRARNGVTTAVHPTNPDIAWLGTDGGLFKTTDGGAQWRRLTSGLPTGATKGTKDISQTVTKIIVDDAKPDLLWISIYATGLNEPAGIWRSEDGGETWSRSSEGIESGMMEGTTLPVQRDWAMLLVRSASDPQVFYTSSVLSLYRSADGAKTWKKLPRTSGTSAMAVHPNDPQRVFIAGEKSSVEESRDGGETWSPLGNGLPSGDVENAPVQEFTFVGPDGKKQTLQGRLRHHTHSIYDLTFAPHDPSTLYACATAGIYRLPLK